MMPLMLSSSTCLLIKPTVDITEIQLSFNPDVHPLILFQFFLVISNLGTLPFLFYPIFGSAKMVPYHLAHGLPANSTTFSQKSFLGTLSVLGVLHTWLPSVYQMRRSKQWTVGLPRLGTSTFEKILLSCLPMCHLHLFLIFLITMLECLLSTFVSSFSPFFFTTIPPLLLSSTVIPSCTQNKRSRCLLGLFICYHVTVRTRYVHKLEFNGGMRLNKACVLPVFS